ncbi:autotransporter-associated N-terminal domain-containing protein [Fusobacterium sp. PH5-44]|uniref:autotransporter-associated N-terminal domain-containing protein n=1 Tax=unclassified Fusobacterium TaxID=2648384 RepID=UPI003D241E32
MRKNMKEFAEKSLKSFLKKKKIGYTVALLTAFLITGGIGLASEPELSVEAARTQEGLLYNIEAQKAEIQAMLEENEARLKQLQMDRLSMINEADWYSKPWYPSYFMSLGGSFTKADNENKKWVNSDRDDTENDQDRRAYGNYEKQNYKGTGWVMNTSGWNSFTNVYDNEAKLTIIPILTPPEVLTPAAPSVAFTIPNAPASITPPTVSAPAPISMNVTITPASVNIPLVSQPTIPNIDIDISEQNVNVNVGAISLDVPGTVTIPTLSPPVPSLTVTPKTPPNIVPPNPQVTTPNAPAAPNFSSYVAAGGSWLNWSGENGPAGNNTGMRGYNPLNHGAVDILAASTNASASKTDAQNLSSGTVKRLSDVTFPLFGSMNLTGTGGGRGRIYAYRTSNTVAATGYSNVSSNSVYGSYTPQYYSPNNGGSFINISASNVRPGHSGGAIADAELNQKNRWVFHNHVAGTLIENIDFTIGGMDQTGIPKPEHSVETNTRESGVLLLRNDSTMKIENSTITLLGETTISVDILHWGAHYLTSLELKDVTIDIKGDENTLFSNVSYSDQGVWRSPDLQAQFATWGAPQLDNGIGKQGVFGKTDLGIDTKINTIYYIRPNTSYRWNGYNGGTATLSDGSTVSPYSSVTNPESFLVYTPAMGRVRYENKDNSGNKGTFYFNGSGNVGTWVNKYIPDRTKYSYNSTMAASEAPIIDLGKVMMNGDGNVGIYLAQNNDRPDYNGIFMGTLPIDFNIGTSLNGASGTSQSAAGNTDGDASKSSGNVALYVASGQRNELTVVNGYFPATTNMVTTSFTNYNGGMGAGIQIGYPDLNTTAHTIKNLKITDFSVNFGKYSKDNIAVVARNGSVVELSPSTAKITDGQTSATPDADRATGTIMAFAEGVWYNPRVAVANTTTAGQNNAINNPGKVVIDGTPGKLYVPQYGSAVLISKPIEMGSKEAVAVFAKDGAKIEAQSITIHGAGSTGAFASGTRRWSASALESNTSKGGGTAAASNIKINGNIIVNNGDKNKGVVAMSGTNGDGANVTVTGNLNVKGLGAYVEGKNSTVNIQSGGSTLVSGTDGSLVALNGGKLNFAGGTITHNVADTLAFFSGSDGTTISNINFAGSTTLNIGAGVVFYGAKDDYSAGGKLPSETGRYTGMNKVTVNLTDDGVNLGVFENVGPITWDGNSSTYLNTLKDFPKVLAINDNGKWYESSLEGADMALTTDVNRDIKSLGSFIGDKFNDITFERSLITLAANKTVKSTQGNTMAMASNTNGTSNTQTGYIVNGTFDITNGSPTSVGAFVNYGQIQTGNTGKIIVDKGVAAYGVNGSKIINNGDMIVTGKGQAIVGLSRAVKDDGTEMADSPKPYGTDAGTGGPTALLIEIENNGLIDIQGQDNSVAIYADNNIVADRDRISIKNTEKLVLGDKSVGIMMKGADNGTKSATTLTGEGGQVFLTTTGSGVDITVGADGLGVYGENSDIDFGTGTYTIETKDGGAAIYTLGASEITGTKLHYVYTGSNAGTAAGLIYEGIGASNLTNTIAIDVDDTVGTTGLVTGIFAKSKTTTLNDTLTNSGNITIVNNAAFGIVSEDVKIINTGIIKSGQATGDGGTGIYLKNAAVDTAGDKIIVEGTKAIGIYALRDGGSIGRDLEIKAGTSAMLVDGDAAIGVFVDDDGAGGGRYTLKSDTDITLKDSNIASGAGADRRIGLVVMESQKANYTDGEIIVGKNNIGVYNKNAVITNDGNGKLDVTHDESGTENIGLHALADGGTFTVYNKGKVEVEGVTNIGISLETVSASDSGTADISDGNISVLSTSMADGDISVGVFGNGENIKVLSTTATTTTTTVGANAIGIYLEGTGTTTFEGDTRFDLESDGVTEKVGIGAYFTGGAYAANNGKVVEVNSTNTDTNSSGEKVRPIGLYYATGSDLNETSLEIISGSQEAIGMYINSDVAFTNDGHITINKTGIGAYAVDTDVTNNGDIFVNDDDSYGLFLKGGDSISTGLIESNASETIGVIAKDSGTTYSNQGTITTALTDSIGAAAINGAYISNDGTVSIDEGYGMVASGTGSTVELLSGSDITETTPAGASVGAIGMDSGAVIMSGGDITMDDTSIGVFLENATGDIDAGNITVGVDGVGIYADNSSVDLVGYSDTITIGNKGVAIYSHDSTLAHGGTLDIAYDSLTADKGVGIYYKSTTPGSTVTNDVAITHTGKHLVDIYADGVNLTNTSNQQVQEESIGLYGDNNATISNQGTLDLNGKNAVGVYLTGNSTLTDIGTITGADAASTTTKIGVYVANGDITGNAIYNFGVSGGIGMYLQNSVVSYNGTINVTGPSVDAGTRTMGIYVGKAVTGTLNTNINVTSTGEDAIALYLEGDTTPAANITFNGSITMSPVSDPIDKGIGAYLGENTTLTLGATGSMTIGGSDNIGFYVDKGTLNVSGGTVTNDPDGIFAYVNEGVMNFTFGTVPNIDYVNVIVSGVAGSVTNDTTITVGTAGLQGVDRATITNTVNGKITATVDNGMAMAGIDTGTNIINSGKIELSGDKSVGMYTASGAIGTSTGSVEVGQEGVAYYVATGGTINVSGTTKVGQDGSMMYSTGGTINYTGTNIVGDDNTTVATVTDAGALIDLNGKDLTVGEQGTGIFVKNTATQDNVINIGTFSVGKEATGIYLDNNLSTTVSNALVLSGQDAIGVLRTNNEDTTFTGVINSTQVGAKGIVSTGTGNVINNGTINVRGQSNIGIYGENTTNILNSTAGSIEVGSGTATASSVAIYGKNAATVDNDGIIKLDAYGVGIYGENSAITNTGTIQNALGNNTGIYGKNSSVNNTGIITLSATSNGIYTENGSITNTGSVTVGNTKSAGLYGGGNSRVDHLGGTVKVGDKSVGIATDAGHIVVASGAQIIAGEQSTYIYSKTGTAENHQDMAMNKYGIGMYTQSGVMDNYAKITIGESDVTTGNVRVSVGMATESGAVNNHNTIDLIHKNGVGMLANDGGTATNHGTINASSKDSYAMQATESSILRNYGTINVTGDGARGMVAIQNSIVENYNTINVTGVDAEGIYVETGSTAANHGNITVSGPGVGIKIGTGGILVNSGTITVSGGGVATKDESSALTQVGDITIDGPKISIDGATIDNVGHIVINGALDFGTVNISGNGNHDYVGTISAETFDKGQFVVLSDVTQGSNKGAYIIQYLQSATNVPNNGNITAISQSVSYVVDLQKDPLDSNKISIVLVKVPYIKMMEGTKAIEFAKGLDELYTKAAGVELEMFDGLDSISDDDELATTFENELRGNEYANIQDRMLDIGSVFDTSYENLKHNRLYTKDSLKIGLITTKGESKYSDPAIIDYDQTSLGFMAMKEYDTRTFGQKYGWHLGFAQNKFEFDTDSEETVYSLNLGMSYERNLGSDRLKWHSRAELTINHHEMDRKIDISGTRYSNDSKYWSGMAMLKNKIRYENVNENGNIRAGIEGTFDLGYGRYFDIEESGDGMFLELPARDMYTIRPGLGADVAFTARTKRGGKFSLIGKASVEYELGKIYDGPNRAKFKGTDSGYYDLEKPKKEELIGKVGAELKYESITGNSIGFEVTRQEGRRDSTRYGVNLMMRLGN